MNIQLADLISKTTPDSWRLSTNFGPELDATNEVLWEAADDDKAINGLAKWLHHHQPCLFGRIAARGGQLSYCVIREADIAKGDNFVRDKIQSHRLAWTQEAFYGRASGFVILLASRRLAYALPNEITEQIALRLCSLYLLEEITPDVVYMDRVWLEVPGPDRHTWEWKVGANYFSSHGDGRWWQDHRIPGGVAFSMNSVGHFVKSGALAKGMRDLEQSLGIHSETWDASKIDNLERALELAMRTIANAAHAVSGRATELLNGSEADADSTSPKCPFQLPPDLAKKDYCRYLGHYHTDHTVPSVYFRPDVTRPDDIDEHVLDFTYLFHRSIDNPDHETMGSGRPIRADDDSAERLGTPDKYSPILRVIEDCDRLVHSLKPETPSG